jgi:hypothetical protein
MVLSGWRVAAGETDLFAGETSPPAKASKKVALEGAFGKAEVDTGAPALVTLFLRQPDGTLSAKSLLSEHASEFPAWAVGGVTHVRGTDDTPYTSRHSSGHAVPGGSSSTHLVLAGIRLRSVEGRELPALEDWEFRVEADGNLNWTVRRRWESDFQAKFVGEPALFFNTRPNAAPTASGQQRLNPAGNGVVP